MGLRRAGESRDQRTLRHPPQGHAREHQALAPNYAFKDESNDNAAPNASRLDVAAVRTPAVRGPSACDDSAGLAARAARHDAGARGQAHADADARAPGTNAEPGRVSDPNTNTNTNSDSAADARGAADARRVACAHPGSHRAARVRLVARGFEGRLARHGACS